MKKIGFLCSGGDSPGMNCAIRAIVRTALYHNIKPVAIHQGYAGLLQGKFTPMDASSVGNIIQRGGTIIQTSRCPEFHEKKTRKKAAELLRKQKIEGLIVIGGDGSFNGAQLFSTENNFPVIGIPGTIDNDISSTEYTIGFDTAIQTAIEAVDRIRDTASSHARIFLVEVMGRNSSSIAMKVAVCTGAENVIVPKIKVDYQEIADGINRGISRGKTSSIIIVAEGEKEGRSYEIQKNLREKFQLDSRVCILGHVQRGGSPSALDRYVASHMGHIAVKALIEKKFNTVAVVKNGKVTLAPLSECLAKTDPFKEDHLLLAKILSI
ncbi:MAG: 6-phosphofructokinase [Bacteriovoracaceae bacterium]|nr:6-phosphofructokinase [Bacteriovoracaceae bacterium]